MSRASGATVERWIRRGISRVDWNRWRRERGTAKANVGIQTVELSRGNNRGSSNRDSRDNKASKDADRLRDSRVNKANKVRDRLKGRDNRDRDKHKVSRDRDNRVRRQAAVRVLVLAVDRI